MASKHILFFVVVAELSLSACQPAVRYYNPNINDNAQLQRQFAIDDGYCVSAAAGSVPIPQVRIYNPAPNSYSFSGQATTYNPYSGYSTTTYEGTAYSYPTSGFSEGFANGMNIGAAMAARNNQNRVYHGCMVALGWTTNERETVRPRQAYIEGPEGRRKIEVCDYDSHSGDFVRRSDLTRWPTLADCDPAADRTKGK